jgi:hypothetical protein
MSILETFYILFKSDTSELKKGADEAYKTTEKLSTSIKSTNQATEMLGKSFMGFASHLTTAVAAFVSLDAVVHGLKNAIDYDIELGRASKALGVNVTELDAWGNAVKTTGGTAESFQGSLKNLAAHFHTTAGVAIKALPQLSDVLSKVSRFSAFNFGKSIGLDEATILLLQQGRREVQEILKQQKELGLVTKDQIDISLKYDNSLNNLQHAFRSLYNAIAVPLTPYLTVFLEKLTQGIQYLTQHKDLVVGALTAIATVFGIIAIETVIAGGTISLVIGLVLGLIAVFAILFEDISVYMKGGKSFIGEYIQQWKNLFDIIVKGWGLAKNAFMEFLDFFKGNKSEFNIFGGNKEVDDSISQGRLFSAFASNTPLNSQTSSSIVNSRMFSRNSSVNTGPITINTQSQDAVGIAKDLDINLKYQLRDTANNFADNTYA